MVKNFTFNRRRFFNETFENNDNKFISERETYLDALGTSSEILALPITEMSRRYLNETQDIPIGHYNAMWTMAEDEFGKAFLSEFPDATIALSLNKLSKEPTNVVRVRRASDNAERDFNANEVKGTVMLDWVNTDVLRYQMQVGDSISLSRMGVSYVDGVSDGTTTFDGVLRGVVTSLESTVPGAQRFARIIPSNTNPGDLWNVKFKYFIPTGQNSDRVRVHLGISGVPDSFTDDKVGVWTQVDFTGAWENTSNNLGIALFDSEGNTEVGDEIFIKDWEATQLTANGQVPVWYDQRVPTVGSKTWFNNLDVSVNLNTPIFPLSGDFDVEIDVYYDGYNVTTTHDFYLSQDTATSDICGFGISGQQEFRAFARSASNQLTGPVATVGTHTLRLTRVGNLWSFYVNGEFQESVTQSTNPADTSTIVGNNTSLSGNRHVKGSVFNIRRDGVLLYSGDYSDDFPWMNKVNNIQGTINGIDNRVSTITGLISCDAVQETALNQPFIVIDGEVVADSVGNPSLQNVDTQWMASSQTVTTPANTGQLSFVTVAQPGASNESGYITSTGVHTDGTALYLSSGTGFVLSNGGGQGDIGDIATFTASSPILGVVAYDNNTTNIRVNGIQGTNTVAYTFGTATENIHIFNREGGASSATRFAGKISCLIFYNTKSNADDILNIEKSINSKFKVY